MADRPVAEMIRQFYNRMHLSHSRELDPHERARLHQIEAAMKQFVVPRLNREASILDLGCGRGWLAERLTAYGTVTGYDMADEALQDAARRHPQVRFVSGDLLRASTLGDGEFDLVVCSEVIEHIEDQRALIDLVYRILRTPGLLILTCPNRKVERDWWTYPWAVKQPVERWLTQEDLHALLEPRFRVRAQWSFVGDYPGWFFPRSRRTKWARLKRRGLVAVGLARLRAAMGLGLYLITCAEKLPGGT